MNHPDPKNQTVIRILWLLLLLTAALLRLTDLDAAPLSSAEAQQGLSAYWAAQGLETPVGSSASSPAPSPIILHLNTLLFSLFEAGDGLARLIPALAGIGLVATPLLLRRYLGRWGAWGAGLMLALSPTTLLLSRTLDGSIVAALGVMILVGCAAHFLDSWRSRLVTLGGLGLALALTSGGGGWALLIGLLLTLAGALWVWWEQITWLWPMIRPALGRGLIVTGLGMLALGSGLGLNPAGLAATGGQLANWLNRFTRPTPPLSPSPFTLLLAYEPLILLIGLVGLMLVMRRRHGMGIFMSFWMAMNGIQLALMPGRQQGDILWVLLPLAILGGLAIKELARSLTTQGQWLSEGIYLPISLVLWTHGGLALASYAQTGELPRLLLALMTVLLQILLTLAFGFVMSTPEAQEEINWAIQQGMETALRVGGLSFGILLLLVTLSIGWGLTHLRPADPRELALQEPTAVEVRLLAQTARHVSRINAHERAGLPITFLDEVDPAVAWALRHFDPHIADQMNPENPPPLILTSTQEPPAEGYFGQTFPLRRSWTPQRERWARVRWWTYREGPPPIVTEQITLWVRQDLGTAPLEELTDYGE